MTITNIEDIEEQKKQRIKELCEETLTYLQQKTNNDINTMNQVLLCVLLKMMRESPTLKEYADAIQRLFHGNP